MLQVAAPSRTVIAPSSPVHDNRSSSPPARLAQNARRHHARENSMTELTRRAALTGAAAVAAAPLVAPQANAAAPATGKQAPAYYRYKVGDFEVTAILDGVRQV